MRTVQRPSLALDLPGAQVSGVAAAPAPAPTKRPSTSRTSHSPAVAAATAAALLGTACLTPPPSSQAPSADAVQNAQLTHDHQISHETSKTSNLDGSVVAADTSQRLGNARVAITDVLGRTLELNADETGTFRFENIPPGKTTITVSAPGYAKTVTAFVVEPLTDIRHRFSLSPEPK